MGLFDFLKGKNTDKAPSKAPVSQNGNESQGADTIHYETKITSHEMKADPSLVQSIVEKMVDEDPFKNFFNGKTPDDFTPLTARQYKYEAITTVNVDFVSKEKDRVRVNIESLPLGFLSEEKAGKIQSYQEKYLLTAYVYVTGGPYLEYDKTVEKAVEKEAPYGLDIYVQFT